MDGKIVSSKGAIELGSQETEREIRFDKPVYYLSLIIEYGSKVFVNDDEDHIGVPKYYTQPLIIKDIPIWSIKVCRDRESLEQNTDDEYPFFEFYYYGYK